MKIVISTLTIFILLTSYIFSENFKTFESLRIFDADSKLKGWKFFDIVGPQHKNVQERLALNSSNQICILRELPKSTEMLKALFSSIVKENPSMSKLDLCKKFVSFLITSDTHTLEVYPSAASIEAISSLIRSLRIPDERPEKENMLPPAPLPDQIVKERAERGSMYYSLMRNTEEITSNESLVLIGMLEDNNLISYSLYLSKNEDELVHITIEKIDQL
jgi:hypothetical protein